MDTIYFLSKLFKLKPFCAIFKIKYRQLIVDNPKINAPSPGWIKGKGSIQKKRYFIKKGN